MYSFGGPVAGFQFDLTGLALTGASGGAAGDAGMTVSSGGATVVGFSLTNSEIPAGDGVLTVLAFSGVTADMTDLSLGNFGAITDASGNVYDATASGSIDHPTDCAGDYYGSAVEDCAGEWGGSAVEDGCDDACG